MIKTVCDLCHREVKGNTAVLFCERCLPFAEAFLKERNEVWLAAAETHNRTLESFRNKFLRENVIRKKEEA